MNELVKNSNAVVKGSLGDVVKQTKQTLATQFLSVKAFVAVDVSASMADRTAQGKTRWELAKDQLEKLQAQNAGEIALACFSDDAVFSPMGAMHAPNGCTDLVAALQLLKQADNCGIRLIIISDGEPNDAASALGLAQTFVSKIDTIFVGDETGAGRDFLRSLAQATGGVAIVNHENSLNLLSENITRLIAA